MKIAQDFPKSWAILFTVLTVEFQKFRLNKIAARWPAKAVAQFYFY